MYLNSILHINNCQFYPIKGILKAVKPVFTGEGVLSEVHCVRNVGGGVLQQRKIHQLPLQTIHFQHVKLNKQTDTEAPCYVIHRSRS